MFKLSLPFSSSDTISAPFYKAKKLKSYNNMRFNISQPQYFLHIMHYVRYGLS